MADDVHILHIVDSLSNLADKQIGSEGTAHAITGQKIHGAKDEDGRITEFAGLDENVRFGDLEATGTFTWAGLANYFQLLTNDSDDITEGSTNLFVTTAEKTLWNTVDTLDSVVQENNLLSRTIDASSGHVTGINAGALPKDAVNRLALQRATMPLLPVISELATPPSSPSPGDRYLVAAGATGAWADHDGEIAAAVADAVDITTWVSCDTTGFDNIYTDIIRIPEWNLWLKCARTGTGNRIVYSRDCGDTWNACTAPDSAWESMAFASEISTACVVGDAGAVATTTDGITWTAQTGSNTNDHRGICWASGFGSSHGRFVVISASGTGNRAMYSSTGATGSWSDGTTPVDETFNSLCFSPELSQVCAFAYSGTNRVIATTDGATWTLQSATTTNTGTWYDSVWAPGFNNGAGAYFAVSSSSGDDNILTSSDGISFSTISSGTNTEMKAICYAVELDGGTIAISCSSGTLNRVITTNDAITWTYQTTPADISYDAIAWGLDTGNFMSCASTGTANRAMTSKVITRWMYEPVPEGETVRSGTTINYSDGTVSNENYGGNREYILTGETTTVGLGTDSTTLLLNAGDATKAVPMLEHDFVSIDVSIVAALIDGYADEDHNDNAAVWTGTLIKQIDSGGGFSGTLAETFKSESGVDFTAPVFSISSEELVITVEAVGTDAAATLTVAWQAIIKNNTLNNVVLGC